MKEENLSKFEQAFFLLIQLPYLQPFEDVNERTSRLSLNLPLLKNSYAPFSFIDVPKQDYTDAILSIYELNEAGPMVDLFVWGYERSSRQYNVMKNTLIEPDLFYMKYRNEVKEILRSIINRNLHGEDIIRYVDQYAKAHIPSQDQLKFSRVSEKHINALHEGNLAVYKITQEQFNAWEKSRPQ